MNGMDVIIFTTKYEDILSCYQLVRTIVKTTKKKFTANLKIWQKDMYLP